MSDTPRTNKLVGFLRGQFELEEDWAGDHAEYTLQMLSALACELERENTNLRKALQEYGKHHEYCSQSDWDFDKPCICGFEAAINEAEGEK